MRVRCTMSPGLQDNNKYYIILLFIVLLFIELAGVPLDGRKSYIAREHFVRYDVRQTLLYIAIMYTHGVQFFLVLCERKKTIIKIDSNNVSIIMYLLMVCKVEDY